MAGILIVHGVSENRAALVNPLRAQGHTLVEAENGSDGVAIASAVRPDLVITDGHAFVMNRGGVQPRSLERQQPNLARRDERDLARRCLDAAETILVALDVEGRITRINRKGRDLLGWPEQELLGRHWMTTCIPARLQGAVWETFHPLAGEAFSIVERAVLTRSGEERLIEWRNTILRDAEGHVIGTLSSGSDVTERHDAIDAVRVAEERMRFALQNASVGIWDMDLATGTLQWSAILEAQHGLQAGTFGGTLEAFIALVHPDDRNAVQQALSEATRAGVDFSTQHRALWADGTVRWLSGRGCIRLGEDGKPARGVGISQDVTERHALQEQYQQAQKMEVVGRLAGGVAHDFNNLLTVILSYCDILLADLDPDDARRTDIMEIEKAGTSAAALTRQLLAFSRKEIIAPTVLDLNTVVADTLAMTERLIGEDVIVVLALDSQLALVNADRGQVEQVILNLALNGRDAMPHGGTLTIQTANVEVDDDFPATRFNAKPGPYVMLMVTDTGTGMTPDVQARLFEPFFTTKAVGKGTGLGLATVHGIVARSGGLVSVDSELARGTSVKVYFPKVAAGEVAAETPAGSCPARGTEKVLIVEDAAALRELVRRLLQRQGYTALVAANADEALRVVEEHPVIDVLLTDVVMPGVSGPELAGRLVALRPMLRVVYMSGYTEDAIARHGILEPGIDFLQKPFTPDALARKIRKAIGPREQS